jgi:hypothetical protein
MIRPIFVAACVLSGIVAGTAWAHAGGMQVPGGMSVPGIPGGLSKDGLLQQAKGLVSELTSMKSSGKLPPAQAKKADELLPKAQSLNDELEQPQIDAGRLPQLASNLTDLQKQVGALKGFMK